MSRSEWPYGPVLTHSTVRRLLPGMALSYLGDGISVVAVVLLAQELTDHAGLVGLAVAMSTLPGAIGAMALGRKLSGRSGGELARWDATWRFVFLGAIPLAYFLGVLNIGLYIALLAASSVLHSWGSAGRYTLIAELLPQKHHLAGNSLLSLLSEAGTIAGPPVAALILVFWNPVGALAVDALTFGLLALSYRFVRTPARARPPVGESRLGGLRVIAATPALLGLNTLSALFFCLFGPVYVALPTLTESASQLAAYYTAFGIGAVLGGLLTPYLPARSLWQTTLSSVLFAGLFLVPLGTAGATTSSIICFALLGASWAPYQATSMALYQRAAPADGLAPVLAADSAVAMLSAPLGVAGGGLLVENWGAQNTLLFCAVSLIALAAVGGVLRSRARGRGTSRSSRLRRKPSHPAAEHPEDRRTA